MKTRELGQAQDRWDFNNYLVLPSVPPATISLDYNGVTYNDGSSISVVAGDGRQFTCKTPGVYPQTTFTWTLPSGITTDQPLGTTTSSTNTDGTVDSSNRIIVNIAENPATSQLTCDAINRPDGSTQPDISITVLLQIKGTCTSSSTFVTQTTLPLNLF